jgi:hypothetical protein
LRYNRRSPRRGRYGPGRNSLEDSGSPLSAGFRNGFIRDWAGNGGGEIRNRRSAGFVGCFSRDRFGGALF